MEEKIKVLILEDSVTDAELVEHTLRKEGIDFISKRVETRQDFIQELKDFEPDVILSDYALPHFDGMEALIIVKKRRPEVPFILVTGSLGEELTVKLLKEGMTDYILKDNLTRLGPAVRRALSEVKQQTKRKRAEESLRTSEKKYRELVTNSMVGVYQSNLQGDVLFVNEAVAQLLEYGTPEELMGIKAVCSYKNPEVRDKLVAELKKTGMVSNFEAELVSRTGLAKHVLISATFDGRLISGMLLDITERKKTEQALKESEEKLKAIFDNANDGIILAELETKKFLTGNRKILDMLGYQMEEIKNMGVLDIHPQESLPYVIDQFEKQSRREIDIAAGLPVKRKDGTIFYADINASPVKIGSKQYLVGIFRDITEHKKAEEEKGKLQAQLLKSQKMETIGQMVGGIAHDFNNILAAIKGYGELGIMETDKPVPKDFGTERDKTNPIYEYLQHIVSSTDRGANLTKQLLIFSQSHSVDIKTVDLNQLINNLLKMLDRLIGENIGIETKLSPDLFNIKADDGNIEQVVMNLVINARDAMPNGGKIIIKTENMVIEEKYCQLNIESRCGSFVCLSVTDTGIGMTKDVLSHIFEPFFTTKPQGKGTGLGLSVVYGIVKKHQGWANVYSEPEQGTVFKIYLPVSAEKAQAKPDTKIITHSELKGKGERILVVEDDEGIRKVLTNALDKMNYKVFSTSSGQEAREMFDREGGEFDLIISDMVLPDIIGIDLCDEFVKKKEGLKILLSSGYPSRGEYSNLIRERGLPFIPKPYNLQTLFKTIREILTPVL